MTNGRACMWAASGSRRPEVDGITYVSGLGVAPGALVQGDIVESSTYDLTALA